MSIERLLAAIDAEKTELPVNQGIDCYIVTLGEKRRIIPFPRVQTERSGHLK